MINTINLVISVVKEIGQEQNIVTLVNATAETRLFGDALDSMGIVFLVTDLESHISDEFDIDLTLADERAMSQKNSPYKTVKTLAQYIDLLLSEQ